MVHNEDGAGASCPVTSSCDLTSFHMDDSDEMGIRRHFPSCDLQVIDFGVLA